MADVKAVEVPTYINRAGEQLTTPQQRRQAAPVSIFEAATEIRGRVGDLWTSDHYKLLQQRYPDGLVPADDINRLVNEIKNPPSTTLKVVGE